MAKKNETPSPSKTLLDALTCPQTGGNLILSKNKDELISLSAKTAFPIRDGIPIMVESESRRLTEKEVASKKK